MIRASLLCLMLAGAVASSVLGADYPFAARVDVLSSIAVSADFSPGSTTLMPTLTLHGLQDQCLDVRWGEGLPAPGATAPLAPRRGQFSLGRDGRAVLEPDGDAAARSGTIQINLN